MRQAFDALDVNRNGYIEKDSLQQAFTNHNGNARGVETDEFWEKFIGGADQDGDGRIDFDEFRSVMQSQMNIK